VHGQRRAQIGAPRFALWAARELLRTELGRAIRALQRARAANTRTN
jgi:hypothetical protein